MNAPPNFAALSALELCKNPKALRPPLYLQYHITREERLGLALTKSTQGPTTLSPKFAALIAFKSSGKVQKHFKPPLYL